MLKLMTSCLPLFLVLEVGCSSAPARYETPEVDVADAAAKAVELYDANDDGALDKDEVAKCPGILGRLAAYDSDSSESVTADEIESHLDRLLNGVGGTQITAAVSYRGRPLRGAQVIMEPEPYLGDAIQTAKGETDGSGAAKMGIPSEYAPEHLRRLKTVHYGTFKVRITHPSVQLPAKYNSETELGYETEPGKPLVTFTLQ